VYPLATAKKTKFIGRTTTKCLASRQGLGLRTVP
jgi:hypothetical protein